MKVSKKTCVYISGYLLELHIGSDDFFEFFFWIDARVIEHIWDTASTLYQTSGRWSNIFSTQQCQQQSLMKPSVHFTATESVNQFTAPIKVIGMCLHTLFLNACVSRTPHRCCSNHHHHHHHRHHSKKKKLPINLKITNSSPATYLLLTVRV